MSYERVTESRATPPLLPLRPCEFSIGCYARQTSDGDIVKCAIALDYKADPADEQAYKPAVVLESWDDVCLILESLMQAAMSAWGPPPGAMTIDAGYRPTEH